MSRVVVLWLQDRSLWAPEPEYRADSSQTCAPCQSIKNPCDTTMIVSEQQAAGAVAQKLASNDHTWTPDCFLEQVRREQNFSREEINSSNIDVSVERKPAEWINGERYVTYDVDAEITPYPDIRLPAQINISPVNQNDGE